MQDIEYERWWSLHLRVAKGETLALQEESEYADGLNQLDKEAVANNDETVTYLRTLRAAINRAVKLHTELTARSVALDRKIAGLEASYQQLTGQALDWKPYARPDLNLVRQRYAFACGYCGVNEVSAGGPLTVDHYYPLAAGGDDSLDNLVYACIRCNQHKYTYWPTEEDANLGLRVLHPLRDILSHHYQLNPQTGQLEPLTETGRFHITLLHLNRPELIRHRLAQQLREVMEGKLELLERQIHELEETITAQERYISALQNQLN